MSALQHDHDGPDEGWCGDATSVVEFLRPLREQLDAPGVLEVCVNRPGELLVERIEVDTAFFKGNYPDRCSVQAAYVSGGTDRSITTQSMFWQTLLPEQKLEMDAIHTFSEQVAKLGPITHVRFNIFPDGGVSRLRLWGKVEAK